MKVTVNYILRDYLEEYNDEQDYSYQKLYTEHEEYESVNDNYFNFNENDFLAIMTNQNVNEKNLL